MLILQKLRIQFANKSFTLKDQKYLRIQLKDKDQQQHTNVFITKNIAKIINQNSIQWQESISLPAIYNKEFIFEIYDKHKFGYNHQQLSNVISGKLLINNANEKFNNWEIFNHQGQKVGFLSSNIRSREYKSSILSSNAMPKNQVFTISSMAIHLPILKLKKAYVLIKVGDKTVQTAVMRSRSGQLVFIEGYQLQKSSESQKAEFQVYSYDFDTKGNTTSRVATGSLDLTKERMPKKVLLYSPERVESGQILIDCNQNSKHWHETSQMVSSRLHNSIQMQKYQQYGTNSRISNHSFTLTPSQRRINHNHSIVNNNNNIRFPKEQRFHNYIDKPIDKVTYLQNKKTFEFKNKHANKYYRGASIGYGYKQNFISANNPGVGQYKLPSIWDRY